MLAAGTKMLSACSECGKAFMPTRQPTQGKRAFCLDCGKPAALRHASQDYYRRMQAARIKYPPSEDSDLADGAQRSSSDVLTTAEKATLR